MYSRWHKVLNGLDDTHNLHQSEFRTGPHGVGFRRHIYFRLGPQWFMWGGSLYDTHILHQSQFHTGPQGVGFRRHIYFRLGPQWFMWGGLSGWYTHSPPVRVPHWSSWGGIQKTHVFQTRSTMVHVGWVTVWYTHSPPVTVPHWSSGGGIQKAHLYLGICPQWFMWGRWLHDDFLLHRGS